MTIPKEPTLVRRHLGRVGPEKTKHFDVTLMRGGKRTISCSKCEIRGSWVLFFQGSVIKTALPQHAVVEVSQIKGPRK